MSSPTQPGSKNSYANIFNPNLPEQNVAVCPQLNCSFQPLGDRVIVEEDIYRTGYECEECQGERTVGCSLCGGSGIGPEDSKVLKEALRACPQCMGVKKVTCRKCNGKGVKAGGLAMPETSERRVTTGTIVAVGPDVKNPFIRNGAKIIYPFFSGIDVKYKNRPLIRFIYEKEITAIIYGELKNAS